LTKDVRKGVLLFVGVKIGEGLVVSWREVAEIEPELAVHSERLLGVNKSIYIHRSPICAKVLPWAD
jgi:hypothetical protein